jgi:hypothetical protein
MDAVTRIGDLDAHELCFVRAKRDPDLPDRRSVEQRLRRVER